LCHHWIEYFVLLVLDLSQLRNVTLNDEALMREVVDALVVDTEQQINELRRALAKSDSQACVRLAHNAYGACGNVGAVSMATLFGALERHAREGDLERSRSSVAELLVELEKLRSEADSL
jgi:HPt (histidine-containing phosphotransfer) domain-containing protein